MKNQREIHETLLAGHTIVKKESGTVVNEVCMDNEGNYITGRGYRSTWGFSCPEEWSIKKIPKLEITENDVGKVAILKDGSRLVITAFRAEDNYPVKTWGGGFRIDCSDFCECTNGSIVKII